jgi:hypothetical protein
MDPQTKRFTDAPAAIKREIDEFAADKSIPEEERKRVLEELEAASSMAQPVQFPSTIEIITKYYDRLEKNSAEVALSSHARGRQPGPGNSASAWSTT